MYVLFEDFLRLQTFSVKKLDSDIQQQADND